MSSGKQVRNFRREAASMDYQIACCLGGICFSGYSTESHSDAGAKAYALSKATPGVEFWVEKAGNPLPGVYLNGTLNRAEG